MPGLSYPFVYECIICGHETTVERADVQDVHPNPDSIEASHMTLRQRGWLQTVGGLLCPDCTKEAE